MNAHHHKLLTGWEAAVPFKTIDALVGYFWPERHGKVSSMQASVQTVTQETVTLTSTKEEASAFVAALNSANATAPNPDLTLAIQAYNAAGIS